jgi:hypothetical protein
MSKGQITVGDRSPDSGPWIFTSEPLVGVDPSGHLR